MGQPVLPAADENYVGLLPDRTEASILFVALLAAAVVSCGGQTAGANYSPQAEAAREVGVVAVSRKNLESTLVVSSELVPFQQIDVYAKEAGFVKQLNVDYGTHVKAGQVLAVLEIPELQLQLDEDQAEINDTQGQGERERKELDSVQAQHNVTHLQYNRLAEVAKSRPGLVAQQEVACQPPDDGYAVEYQQEISLKTIALKIPEDLLSESGRLADDLHVSRAEYIRLAIGRMNRSTMARLRAKRIAEASRRVRGESMRVNAEFAAFERDPDA